MTGTCPSGQLITNPAWCEEAATALSLSDTTATSSSSAYYSRPLGCVVSTSSYGSDTLYLQTDASSYTSCTTFNYCLCMPPYGETAPPSPNPTPSPTSPTPIPTPDGWVPEYYMIETGTCPSDQVIMDTALCEAAATALGLSDTTVTTSSSSYG